MICESGISWTTFAGWWWVLGQPSQNGADWSTIGHLPKAPTPAPWFRHSCAWCCSCKDPIPLACQRQEDKLLKRRCEKFTFDTHSSIEIQCNSEQGLWVLLWLRCKCREWDSRSTKGWLPEAWSWHDALWLAADDLFLIGCTATLRRHETNVGFFIIDAVHTWEDSGELSLLAGMMGEASAARVLLIIRHTSNY